MKYFKKLHIPVFAAVLTVSLLIVTASSFSSDYFIWDDFGGTWHDANKNWETDTSMCWAGAASNILSWGNWGTPEYSTADAIFGNFRTHWTDQGSLPDVAWRWWLDGEYPPGYPYDDGWSRVDVAGGGDYWPEHNFDSYYQENWDTSQSMSAIDNYFHSGYGVTLAIYSGLGGHALTCWGYGYDDNNDYDKIWITDSDDGLTQLVSCPVSLTGQRWRLGDDYSGWYIGGVESLALVPEPKAFVLYGIGLISLIGIRMKKGTLI